MEPFQQYLAEMFPEDGKRSTSGVVHELDLTGSDNKFFPVLACEQGAPGKITVFLLVKF